MPVSQLEILRHRQVQRLAYGQVGQDNQDGALLDLVREGPGTHK